ncbi:hypothetical protein C8J56DRAFT_1066811 [Mycena floridula]|nr:hypothetical protein C8J56DRAFT_1066811 [Mycena floridula]
MKLDSASLTSANAISIANFLPPKLTAIGTIVAVLVFTLLSQYHSPTKSLEALQDLKSDIESTARETFAANVLAAEFIIDVHEARDQFSLSVSDCRLHYYRLFTTSSLTHSFALMSEPPRKMAELS